MNMREKCEKIGLIKLTEEGKISFDYAYPVEWAYKIQEKTNIFPRGLVWLYDKEGILGERCGICGRPYPVTLYAYIVMRLYEISS